MGWPRVGLFLRILLLRPLGLLPSHPVVARQSFAPSGLLVRLRIRAGLMALTIFYFLFLLRQSGFILGVAQRPGLNIRPARAQDSEIIRGSMSSLLPQLLDLATNPAIERDYVKMRAGRPKSAQSPDRSPAYTKSARYIA